MTSRFLLWGLASLALAGLLWLALPVTPATAPAGLPMPASTAPAAAGPAVAANGVLTPAVHLPLVFNDLDGQYLQPFGYVTYDDVSDAYGLSQMDAAGSGWVTTVVYWAAIEPTAPMSGVHSYQWAQLDALASNAQSKGIRVFALFTGNPAWAAQYPGGPVTNTTHLVNTVSELAERYDGDGDRDAEGSPVIDYWSFYAEPDNIDEWRAKTQGKGWWGHRPADYANLLALLSPAMKTANPNVRIFNGGIAYDGLPGGSYAESFLGGVLQRLNALPGGATRYLDGVAFHFYPINPGLPTVRDKAQQIQGILNTHGVGQLPLLVPEAGYWSDPSAGSSEARQAQHLVQMYVHALTSRVRLLSWYSVFDHGGGTEAHGLFRNQDLNQPKPAYTAYSVLAAELPWHQYLGPLTALGVEGYVFKVGPGQTKTVLWATAVPRTVTFDQACARRVDYLGTVTQIVDGQPGDLDGANGKVTLSVPVNSPIYVGTCS